MLKNFEYYFDDPISTIEELQQLPYSLLKFGYINEYVYDSIHQVLAVIYKAEVKKTAKEHLVDDASGQFMSDFFPGDVIKNAKNKTQFVTDCFHPYKTGPSALVIHRLFFSKPPRG